MRKIKFGGVRVMAKRFLEVFVSGLIPSLLAVWTVIFNTEKTTWHIAVAAVFALFCFSNCILLSSHVRYTRVWELQLTCALVNVLYGAVAALLSQYVGSTVFSMIFAPLRLFELFGAGTRNSIIFTTLLISAATAVFLAIACGRYSRMMAYMQTSYAEDEANPNAGYGAGELFSNIPGDKAYKPTEPGEMPSVNPNEDYDSDSLFNIANMRERYTLRENEAAEESQNQNESYDSGALWSGEMRKGR